ncbi:MAG: hypothetical protein ACOCQW_05765, partial [Halanaerobiaceae bacterium]
MKSNENSGVIGVKKSKKNKNKQKQDKPENQNKSIFPVLIRLATYAQKHYKAVITAIFAILLSTGMGLLPPLLIRYGIDKYIITNKADYLWVIGLLMIGITLFQGLTDYIKRYITEYISQNI